MNSTTVSLALLFAATASPVLATTSYSIDLDQKRPVVLSNHLDLGGVSAGGGSISITSHYVVQNGVPFIPIVGEFHYCRYPASSWEEELRKMKAGGINVVASYVFWNLHERAEGRFDWSGDLDLRRFVELAGKVGLPVIIRIGPFGHGEIRNGGLPDWVYGRAHEVRSNDPGYLALTDRLYAAIGAQLAGLYYKDNGPVIGIQLENELQHSASIWEIRHSGSPFDWTVADRDRDVTHVGVSVSDVANKNASQGQGHMANLKEIARRHGLDTPLYTATGWGNAAIVPKGSLPVTAGYPFPFWAKPEPSTLYLFKDIRKDPDYAPVSYDTDLYPSIPAELGAGMSVVYRRRPYVPEESVEPLIARVLGSGSNGIGYYMYHGGATPAFEGTFYNEDANGLPKINYDYQAPLGQYGQMRSHFQSLRLLHLFLDSFGDTLAPLPSVLPSTNAAISPTNTETLRFAARAAEGKGFLFLINYQDHLVTPDLKGQQLQVTARSQSFRIPRSGTFELRSATSAILPVNMDLGGTVLRSATVQPLTRLRANGRQHYVFFSIPGFPAEMVFAGGNVSAANGCTVKCETDAVVVQAATEGPFSFEIEGKQVLVVPRQLALQAVRFDEAHLFFTDAMCFNENGGYTLVSHGKADCSLSIYPALPRPPELQGAVLSTAQSPTSLLSAYSVKFPLQHYATELRKVSEHRYAVRLDPALKCGTEALLRVDYTGDNAMAFIEGQMIDDHFYFGRTWEIGLKRFLPRLLEGKEIVLVFHGMKHDASYLEDIPAALRPGFKPGQAEHLDVRSVDIIPEYRAHLLLSEETR